MVLGHCIAKVQLSHGEDGGEEGGEDGGEEGGEEGGREGGWEGGRLYEGGAFVVVDGGGWRWGANKSDLGAEADGVLRR